MKPAGITKKLWEGVGVWCDTALKLLDAGDTLYDKTDVYALKRSAAIRTTLAGNTAAIAQAHVAGTPGKRLQGAGSTAFTIAKGLPGVVGRSGLWFGARTIGFLGGWGSRIVGLALCAVAVLPAAAVVAVIEAPHQAFRSARWFVKGAETAPAPTAVERARNTRESAAREPQGPAATEPVVEAKGTATPQARTRSVHADYRRVGPAAGGMQRGGLE